MKIRVNVFDQKSITDAIKRVEQYRKDTEKKTQLLIERLAQIGGRVAEDGFTGAYYTGNNDVDVRVDKISENRWAITASGQAVCFIEFGTGVYYNAVDMYPKDRPAGVVGIGEYGYGQGKRQGWYYPSGDGEHTYTHGLPAKMPLYKADLAIQREILSIAREVFDSD